MTLDEFKIWARDHATAFGMSDPNDAAMILSWFNAFDAAGFIVADLRAATTTMIAKTPPQFRQDHLRMIQANASIYSRQRATKAKGDESIGGGWTCSLCSGSGWATVPHPTALAGGKMVRGITMAVACLCGRGMATANMERRPISLSRYEKWNPGWRDQLETWERGLTEMAKAKSKAETVDKSAKEIVHGLATILRMPSRKETERIRDPLEF